MIPLRVTAHMATGFLGDPHLPLDGLLASQALRAEYGTLDVLPDPALTGCIIEPTAMPLERVTFSTGDWCWACSFAQLTIAARGRDHWNKRFDTKFAERIDFAGKRGKVVVEAGRYKALHVPVFSIVTPRIDWYVVGDRAAIDALLTPVPFIGKKRAQGWGEVLRWEVVEVEHDWSLWQDDRLMRAIPLADALAHGGRFSQRYHTLRPPYWWPATYQLCAFPLLDEEVSHG